MKIRLTAALGLSAALLLSACAANEPNNNTPAEPADTAAVETTPAADDATTDDEATDEEAPAPANLEGTLSGIGASAQEVAQQTWIVGFQTANPNVTINYSPEGSGAGREAFIGGGADYAGSDRAFKQEEIDENTFSQCVDKPINLPVYISPIAVVFNLEGVEELNMDADTLTAVFKGDITNWNDEKIAALNEGVELPDTPITAVHRSDTSGTTENFLDYLSAAAPSVYGEDTEVSGDWPFPGGEAAAQTQGVVSAVSGGVGTIGYVDASQAGDFTTVKLGKDGSFHGPTTDAAAAIVENSPVQEGRADNDMAIEVDREAEGYPIVLVSYLIVCQDYQDDAKAELVKAYANYIASQEGQQAAGERAGSAPLSQGLTDSVTAAIDSIQ